MNRLLLLILGILVLGLIIWFAKKGGNSDLASAYQFAVPEAQKIYSIKIHDQSKTVVRLNRGKEGWLYNDIYVARPDAIENLLDAITRVELKFIPRKAAIPGMLQDLKAHGIHVEIFDRSGSLLKKYTVGGTTPDERGTYMKMDQETDPVVTHIPGWEGALRNRFWMRPVEWRDRILFQEKLENIKSVAVNYPKQRASSFRIERRADQYVIRPFYEITPRIDRPLKMGSIEAYLRGFKSVGAESIVEDRMLLDSLKSTVPFAVISLENRSGKINRTSLYPIVPEVSGTPRSSLLRYYAINSQEDLYVVQQLLFKKLFWGYDFFFTDDV